ncbi:MAG TPA: ABC transporter substrate-binding protein [Candidatus Margulisiibacteriota bacterium]|nr:ABC transporter substrate-binding protein [Candidatus Margulisiibacteriota bacterium]
MRRSGSENPESGRNLVAIAVLLSSLAAAGGCSRTTHPSAPPVQAPPAEIRVGIAPIYPPLAFKENGQLKGIEVDFAHQLSLDLGQKFVLVELPWDDLIPALRAGRIDVIMSGMSVTEERSKLVSFTDWYVRAGQMALIRRKDYEKLRKPGSMDLPTSRVGFQTNSTGELYARQNLTKAKLKGYPTLDAGIEALRAKQIDFFIYDAPAIWRIRGQLRDQYPDLTGRYTPLTDEHLAWAVRQDDPTLRDNLNAELQHWKKDGYLESILDHWIPVRKITVLTSP